MERNTILLYSGGLDSTTALFEFSANIALAVSFDYGSKHAKQELAAASSFCSQLGVPHRVIKMDLGSMGLASDLLLSGGEIPHGAYDKSNMQCTVVPFRNGIMLSVCAGLAETLGCQQILLANHAGDHAIYPDCTPEFVTSMNEAIAAGTYTKTQLFAPYTHLTKREIALRGKALGVPYEHTWSCYEGKGMHCGRCATCLERKEALEGFDSTSYME